MTLAMPFLASNTIDRLLHKGSIALPIMVILGISIETAQAQSHTHVYVENNSSVELVVQDVVVSGDKLSVKAWKKGSTIISQGKREWVVRINRSGKFNWMDPTPRFIEPGKTVVFSSTLVPIGLNHANAFDLRQKLLGTGKSSKMWHTANVLTTTDGKADSSEVGTETHKWTNNDKNYTGIWRVNEELKLSYSYRAFKDKKATHIEYVFTNANQ